MTANDDCSIHQLLDGLSDSMPLHFFLFPGSNRFTSAIDERVDEKLRSFHKPQIGSQRFRPTRLGPHRLAPITDRPSSSRPPPPRPTRICPHRSALNASVHSERPPRTIQLALRRKAPRGSGRPPCIGPLFDPSPWIGPSDRPPSHRPPRIRPLGSAPPRIVPLFDPSPHIGPLGSAPSARPP